MEKIRCLVLLLSLCSQWGKIQKEWNLGDLHCTVWLCSYSCSRVRSWRVFKQFKRYIIYTKTPQPILADYYLMCPTLMMWSDKIGRVIRPPFINGRPHNLEFSGPIIFHFKPFSVHIIFKKDFIHSLLGTRRCLILLRTAFWGRWRGALGLGELLGAAGGPLG